MEPDEKLTSKILEDFLTFMKGLISLPLYVPGTPYAKAVKVLLKKKFRSQYHKLLCFYFRYQRRYCFLLFLMVNLQARKRISCTVRSIMEERRKADVGLRKGDFLDVLLDNEGLNDEGKVSIVLDLLLGGYETTSILMSMVVYFLGHSPHALDQIKVPIISAIPFSLSSLHNREKDE